MMNDDISQEKEAEVVITYEDKNETIPYLIIKPTLEDAIYLLNSLTKSFPTLSVTLENFTFSDESIEILGHYNGKPHEIFVNLNERMWTVFCEGNVIKCYPHTKGRLKNEF